MKSDSDSPKTSGEQSKKSSAENHLRRRKIVERYLRENQNRQMSPPPHEVRQMLDRALRVLTGNLQEVAEAAGVAYSTLRAWADGRRNPSPENLRRVADVIERRGGELQALADELRKAAGE